MARSVSLQPIGEVVGLERGAVVALQHQRRAVTQDQSLQHGKRFVCRGIRHGRLHELRATEQIVYGQDLGIIPVDWPR